MVYLVIVDQSLYVQSLSNEATVVSMIPGHFVADTSTHHDSVVLTSMMCYGD